VSTLFGCDYCQSLYPGKRCYGPDKPPVFIPEELGRESLIRCAAERYARASYEFGMNKAMGLIGHTILRTLKEDDMHTYSRLRAYAEVLSEKPKATTADGVPAWPDELSRLLGSRWILAEGLLGWGIRRISNGCFFLHIMEVIQGRWRLEYAPWASEIIQKANGKLAHALECNNMKDVASLVDSLWADYCRARVETDEDE
jgi:hypothetical protein